MWHTYVCVYYSRVISIVPHACTYICKCIHMYVHTYVCACIRMCIITPAGSSPSPSLRVESCKAYVCGIHTYVYTQQDHLHHPSCMLIHMHMYVCTHISMCVHTYVFAYICICIYINIHMYVCTHISRVVTISLAQRWIMQSRVLRIRLSLLCHSHRSHTCMCILMYMYTYIHIYIYTHTYVCEYSHQQDRLHHPHSASNPAKQGPARPPQPASPQPPQPQPPPQTHH
jgi:hypothetical protein